MAAIEVVVGHCEVQTRCILAVTPAGSSIVHELPDPEGVVVHCFRLFPFDSLDGPSVQRDDERRPRSSLSARLDRIPVVASWVGTTHVPLK